MRSLVKYLLGPTYQTLFHIFDFTNFSDLSSLKKQQFYQALLTKGLKASGLPYY